MDKLIPLTASAKTSPSRRILAPQFVLSALLVSACSIEPSESDEPSVTTELGERECQRKIEYCIRADRASSARFDFMRFLLS